MVGHRAGHDARSGRLLVFRASLIPDTGVAHPATLADRFTQPRPDPVLQRVSSVPARMGQPEAAMLQFAPTAA